MRQDLWRCTVIIRLSRKSVRSEAAAHIFRRCQKDSMPFMSTGEAMTQSEIHCFAESGQIDGISDGSGLFGRDQARLSAGYGLEHTGYLMVLSLPVSCSPED